MEHLHESEMGNRIPRKDAVGMSELVSQYIKEMKLTSGLDRQRVFAAWNEVSGASRYTVGLYFRNGMLYCTISSSMVRSQLYFQRDLILKKINEFLKNDELFSGYGLDHDHVKGLILK